MGGGSRSQSSSRAGSRGSTSKNSKNSKFSTKTWSCDMQSTTTVRGRIPFQQLGSPVLDIKCMQSIPVAVVSCGDGGRNGTETGKFHNFPNNSTTTLDTDDFMHLYFVDFFFYSHY